MLDYVNRAWAIAQEAHEGQLDKGGESYITHPQRVAAKVAACGGSYDQVAAAFLHDVIEDTEWTAEMLLIEGIPERVVNMVQLLSKVPNEPNKDYIARIVDDPEVALVKYCDIYDNLDPARQSHDGPHNQARRIKSYGEALIQLSAVLYIS